MSLGAIFNQSRIFSCVVFKHFQSRSVPFDNGLVFVRGNVSNSVLLSRCHRSRENEQTKPTSKTTRMVSSTPSFKC